MSADAGVRDDAVYDTKIFVSLFKQLRTSSQFETLHYLKSARSQTVQSAQPPPHPNL